MYLVCHSGASCVQFLSDAISNTLKTKSRSLCFFEALHLSWLSSGHTFERQSLLNCWRCLWLVPRDRGRRPFWRFYKRAGHPPSPQQIAASPAPPGSWTNQMEAKTAWEKAYTAHTAHSVLALTHTTLSRFQTIKIDFEELYRWKMVLIDYLIYLKGSTLKSSNNRPTP